MKPGYEVLTKISRNWNAAQKPLVVQLCAAKYRELYLCESSAKQRSAVRKCVFFCDVVLMLFVIVPT